MKRNALIWSATGILAVGVISSASARPPYLQAFKNHYKTASGKPKLNAANCGLCHIGPANQGKWNAYGEAFRVALGAKGVSDQAKLVAAFKAAESKQNAAAKQSFGQLIAKDEFPATATAPAGGTPPPATGGTGRPGPTPVAGDWEPAFNGVDMTGLTKMNQGNWVVENQVLKYTGGGNGWLRTNKQYKNYSAVIVWRFVEAGPNDAGVFLKAPALTGNPFPQSPQLFMGGSPANYGGISGTQGATNRADLVKPLEWNTYQVTVYNGQATLSINGQKAWDKATGLPNVPGYVGFQNEGRKFEIAQFWIRPLN